MKLLLAILCALSVPAIAQFEEQTESIPQVIFSGKTDDGQLCEVSIESQLEGSAFYMITLKVGQDEFLFVNETLNQQGEIEGAVSSLFQNDNGRYQPIIGAAIFAMGGYTEMGFNPGYVDGKIVALNVLRIDQFAVIGFVETGRKQFTCTLP
jgi:hypothetical protein